MLSYSALLLFVSLFDFFEIWQTVVFFLMYFFNVLCVTFRHWHIKLVHLFCCFKNWHQLAKETICYYLVLFCLLKT